MALTLGIPSTVAGPAMSLLPVLAVGTLALAHADIDNGKDIFVPWVETDFRTVHEKSILLPLLPASFLAIEEPFLFKWMMHYALLSMFPLMCRDELILPYISLSALFILLYHAPGGRKEKRDTLSPSNLKSFAIVFLVLCSLTLHVVYLVMSPPEKYPFLFEAMIMLLCFSQFLFIAGYTNMKQWMSLKDYALENREKKYL